ncbi:MAG: hypothetical protein GWM98_19740, partial [Nitrospinaceae bacterium]|nr:hypothetical protein [Nitrospinaceae bacterium]NIR56306.1 hypothetical protein [Nitrospinaceae bacterium]NIS86763.1 hypothetical protein [Nitrospinaceae bacterium]NIT83598.1 hypothetical protein [Nitrospinaceae bacterium]NIU45800.1 hypothetical protein [Nitrospinaceae bacterium]
MSRRFQDIKRLDQEIRAIQKEMGQFDTSIQELQKMESDQKALQDRLDELNIDWESLNTQKDLYEHVIALLEGQAELEGLETVPGFPENGRETLTRLKQKTDDLKERIEEEKHRLERLEADRDALEINTDLLDREPDVIWLQQSTQAVHAALQDQVAVQQEKDLLEEQVQVDVQEIGPGWNEDRARNFELGETRRGRIQEFQNTLESFRQYENRTRDQLEYHRLKKAEEQSRGWNIPEWLRYFQYLLYGLGLGGVGAGGFLGNIPLVLGAVAVLGLGVVLYRFIKKDPHTFEKEDAVEKRLAQQHERAKQDLDMKFGEWRTWLEDLGLDPTLTPGEVDRIGTAVDQVRFRLGQIRQLDRRLDQMKATIQEAVQGVERIAPSLPDTAALHSDVKANIEIIARYFEDARTHRERKTHLENQCREQAARLEGLNQHYQESLEELHRFIRESGARDEDNFITLHQTLERRKTLQNQGDEKRAF